MQRQRSYNVYFIKLMAQGFLVLLTKCMMCSGHCCAGSLQLATWFMASEGTCTSSGVPHGRSRCTWSVLCASRLGWLLLTGPCTLDPAANLAAPNLVGGAKAAAVVQRHCELLCLRLVHQDHEILIPPAGPLPLNVYAHFVFSIHL